MLFAVELEILNDLTAADRDRVMTDAAQAYRTRGRMLQLMGKSEAAASNLKRAEQLEQDARRLAEKTAAKANDGQIELINRWSGPVTMLIDGVAFRLAVGEKKLIPKAAGTFRYELPASNQVSEGKVEAGKVFRLQIN